MLGLPPLARGAPCQAASGRPGGGPTPAGAGSTSSSSYPSQASSAYPRWRGEHVFLLGLSLTVYGLPPLARGALGVH